MQTHELWSIEERLWTDGAKFYDNHVSGACMMAFPRPIGLLQGSAVFEVAENAPRWNAVHMRDREQKIVSASVRVLGYRARGERDGAAPYECYCTSTYHDDGNGWRLVRHQQTPIT